MATQLEPITSNTDSIQTEHGRHGSTNYDPKLDAILEHEVGYKEYLEGLDLVVSDKESRWVRTKIDMVILPIFLITQMLQFLDKTALNYANLFDYQEDLGLEGQQFNFLSAMVFAGYFFVADLGGSEYISWFNIVRTLASSLTYAVIGRLSDLFGRRWFFIIGNCVALIGILLCSFTPNAAGLIVGAAIYGLGEAIQLSFGTAIGELVPNKYRPMALSFIFLTSAPIATFGTVISRKFIENPNLGWRWCFYVNIIDTGLAIILLFFCYHPPTFDLLHERKTKRQIMMKLDYLGMALWIAGLTVFLLGISWGGGIYPWKSTPVIASIILGVVLLAALGFWETYGKLAYPIIPVAFFKNRGYMALVCCATVASMFYYSAVLLWPQQVSALYTSDITYAGWLSCTVSAATALGQVVSGAIVRWGGNTRYWLIFSAFAMVGFVAALAALTPETKPTGIALTIIGPFFVGFIENCSLSLAPLFLKPADIGVALGLLASIRSAGGSIAIAVYVSILTNRLSTTLPNFVGGAAVDAGLSPNKVPDLLSAISAGTLDELGVTKQVITAVTTALPNAYAAAFKTVYLASLGFGAIAILGSLLSKDARKLLTDKTERKMHA